MDDEEQDDHSSRHSKPIVDLDVFASIRRDVMSGVGYGRPPEHTRFKKGRSGNPKGRPLSMRNKSNLSFSQQPFLAKVADQGQRKINVREGDIVSEVTIVDALIQSILTKAIKGDPRAQGLAVNLLRDAEQKKAEEVKAQNESWSRYKEKARELIANARHNNQPEPKFLPHPDDVVIDAVDGPRFIGPVDEDGEDRMKETLSYCDALLMQDVLDRRCGGRADRDAPGSSFVLFDLLQRAAPPRLRMSDAQIIVRQANYEHWTKRVLLKEVYQVWQRLGKNVPRGSVMPKLDVVKRKIEFASAMIAAVQGGQINLDDLARGYINDAMKNLIDRYGYQ